MKSVEGNAIKSEDVTEMKLGAKTIQESWEVLTFNEMFDDTNGLYEE